MTIPKQGRLFDGLPLDGHALNFSGRVMLEQGSELDMKLRDAAALGQRLRVTVDVFVAKKGGGAKRNKEGDLENVTEAISFKVDSIDVEDFEDLGQA